MKSLSQKIAKIDQLVLDRNFSTISFDIDGTLYPLKKVKIRWWKNLFINPLGALNFLRIKKTWEKRRAGDSSIEIKKKDVISFENFLASLLSADFVPGEIHHWLQSLERRGIKIYFLSDHGAEIKLQKLKIKYQNNVINCLTMTGELKPHPTITLLLKEKFNIDGPNHLHLGDRWTDEEQAKLSNATFIYFTP
jgi:FMN phosphatase YigB (HAD superfamily)